MRLPILSKDYSVATVHLQLRGPRFRTRNLQQLCLRVHKQDWSVVLVHTHNVVPGRTGVVGWPLRCRVSRQAYPARGGVYWVNWATTRSLFQGWLVSAGIHFDPTAPCFIHYRNADILGIDDRHNVPFDISRKKHHSFGVFWDIRLSVFSSFQYNLAFLVDL